MWRRCGRRLPARSSCRRADPHRGNPSVRDQHVKRPSGSGRTLGASGFRTHAVPFVQVGRGPAAIPAGKRRLIHCVEVRHAPRGEVTPMGECNVAKEEARLSEDARPRPAPRQRVPDQSAALVALARGEAGLLQDLIERPVPLHHLRLGHVPRNHDEPTLHDSLRPARRRRSPPSRRTKETRASTGTGSPGGTVSMLACDGRWLRMARSAAAVRCPARRDPRRR